MNLGCDPLWRILLHCYDLQRRQVTGGDYDRDTRDLCKTETSSEAQCSFPILFSLFFLSSVEFCRHPPKEFLPILWYLHLHCDVMCFQLDCLSISVAIIKYHDQSNLEEMSFFGLFFSTTVHHWREIKAGTQTGQGLEVGADTDTMEQHYLLVCFPWLAQLAQDHLPKASPPPPHTQWA